MLKRIMPLLLLAGSLAQGQDKSSSRSGLTAATSPGGTVQKEGGGLQLQNNTGTANFDIPLPELPARGDVRPSLRLVYSQFNGDAGNGFGIGWELTVPSITLDGDGGSLIRLLKPDKDFFSAPKLDGEKLILVRKDGEALVFRPERSTAWTEATFHSVPFTIDVLDGNGIKQTQEFASGFVVKRADGRKQVFSGDSSIAEGVPADSFVARWPLVIEVEANGESIAYTYEKNAADGRSYVKDIIFAGGKSRYSFTTMTTRSNLVDYRSSFQQRNGRLYNKMVATFDGNIAAQWCFAYVGRDATDNRIETVRTHADCQAIASQDLTRKIDPNSINVLDQLRGVYRFGRTISADPQERLPAVYLDYSSWTVNDLARRKLSTKVDSLQWMNTLPKESVELADVNGDSILDVIVSNANGALPMVYYGDADPSQSFKVGKTWSLTDNSSGVPVTVAPSFQQPDWHFADMNGDSLPDVVHIVANAAQVYLATKGAAYERYAKEVKLDGVMPDTFANGRSQWVDVNQDGYTDVIVPTTDVSGKIVLTLHMNISIRDYNGKSVLRFAPPRALPQPIASATSDLLSERNSKIIDITGDQLPDLIHAVRDPVTTHMGYCLYVNTGDLFNRKSYSGPVDQRGLAFGESHLNSPICGKGRFINLKGQNLTELAFGIRDLWFADVNGDGIVDIASAMGQPGQLRVWLGLGDGQFTDAPLSLTLSNPIAFAGESQYRARVADMDGDGQQEIIIFQSNGVLLIDFNRLSDRDLIKSNLLTTVQFESGLRYDLRYANSIDEISRDRKANNPLWNKAALHFPVTLVKQIATSDTEISGERSNVQVEEMLYHVPDYDARGRRFLGFAQVERLLYGDTLAGRITRAAHYTFEEYYSSQDINGPQLRGLLKTRRIHAFDPQGLYKTMSDQSQTFKISDVSGSSLGDWSRRQGIPVFGALKSEQTDQWELAKAAQMDSKVTFYMRLLKSEKRFVSGAEQSLEWTRLQDYDEYNLPATSREGRNAAVGPQGLEIPARWTVTKRDYDASRLTLSELGIWNKPSEETIHALIGHQADSASEGKLLSRKSWIYDSQTGFSEQAKEAIIAADGLIQDRTTNYVRDAFGNLKQATDDLGLVESIEWDQNGIFPEKKIDGMGHETLLFYADSAIGAPFPADFRAGTFPGVVTHGRDAQGLWYFLTYNAKGQLIRYQSSDGGEKRYEYQQAVNSKPNLIKTSTRRYADNAVVPPGDASWIRQIQAVSPDGTELSSVEEHEVQGIRVLSHNTFNRHKQKVISYVPYKLPDVTLDQVWADGDIPVRLNSAGAAFTYYDELGRVSRVIESAKLEKSYTYHTWGQEVTQRFMTLVDGQWAWKTTARSLIRDEEQTYGIIDELNQITRFDRDEWDNLKQIVLPGEPTARTFAYNNQGWMESQVIPGISSYRFSYDTRGRKKQEIQYDNRGRQTNILDLSYDDADRLIEQKVNGKVAIKNTYDVYPDPALAASFPKANPQPIGQLVKSERFDPNGKADFHQQSIYDAVGRVLGQKIEIGNQVFKDRMEYSLDGVMMAYTDAFGVRTQQKLSRSMRPTAFQVKTPWSQSPEDIIKAIDYNDKGQISGMKYAGDVQSTVTYDDDTLFPKMTQTMDRSGRLVQNLSYALDGKGEILSINDAVNIPELGLVSRQASYEYNDRGELVKANRYNKQHEYQYNGAGNFTLNTELDGETWTGTAATTLVPTGTNSHPYQFDASGRLAKGGNILATRFDAFGQLIYAKTAKAEIYLGYSTVGRRVYRKVVPIDGTAARDSYYPMPHSTLENGEQQSFVMLGTQRLARVDFKKKAWYFYVKDHLSSTELMFTSDGTIVEQMLYFAYGSEADPKTLAPEWNNQLGVNKAKLPSQSTRHRFTGQYADDDLGIYDFGLRHYDPQLGRFISPDPVFINSPQLCVDRPIECNLYSYATNNPLLYTDPTGGISWKVVGEQVVRALPVIGPAISLGEHIGKTVNALHAGDMKGAALHMGGAIVAGASLAMDIGTLGGAGTARGALIWVGEKTGERLLQRVGKEGLKQLAHKFIKDPETQKKVDNGIELLPMPGPKARGPNANGPSSSGSTAPQQAASPSAPRVRVAPKSDPKVTPGSVKPSEPRIRVQEAEPEPPPSSESFDPRRSGAV